MSCRVAGGNDSPEKLWDFIVNKKDGSGVIPPMRWEPYYRRDARNAKELDKTTSRGYFVENLENFDSTFFGISPREAELMDPQQRLSLEVCWEALESAGIPPQSLAGSNTAVFMGVNSDDYSKLLLEDVPGIEAWMGIGTAFCGIPNRISYHLDLMGPSTAVDAACASSLVAIHHGRQSLLGGETNVAIVGGVNAMCGPGLTKVLDKAGAISPEGFCRSFDDEARGYGRGEGASVIVLKRMEDAIKNDDRIFAVLKGSAVAQDGRTNGIMAPNGKAQELVARNALNAAGIDPSTIGYVEAHATSTPVGDPVEISAVSNVYGKGRGIDDACYLGSIKPNIGHLEAGAGAMGFMKAVMAVNKGIVPPQANLNKLNSRVNWAESGVEVVREPTSWRNTNPLRRAAIASYGYGGTVSHAVIEEYSNNVEPLPSPGLLDGDAGHASTVLLLSGPQEKRLIAQAKALRPWILGEGRKTSLKSIAKTLAVRRSHHDYRAAFVVSTHEEAAEALKSFSEGSIGELSVSGRAPKSNTSVDSVWVFSGHGAQWPEMGRELLSSAVFYETVATIDPIVTSECGFSALEALKSGDFETADRVQVLTYAMQIGLAATLTAKGITPHAVIGHSIGEIAASVVSGALTPEEGAIVVCRRSVLYRKVMGLGAMILVNSPCAEISQELQGREDIAAAIDSSPSSCVVSGAVDTVSAFGETWKARGIKVLRVKSDVAFHSPVLKKLVDPLVSQLSGMLNPKQPSIKLYSTSLVDPRGKDLRDVAYWVNNMVQPVLLTRAVNAAAEDGLRVFLEVSSHPIVSHSIDETLINRELEDHVVIPTMLRKKPAEKSLLHSIAKLHCRGVSVSWEAQMSGNWAYDVPKTTWQHQSVWRNVATGPLNSANTHNVDMHTLLGQRIPIFGENLTVHTTKLSQDTKPFPGSHPLHGTEIVPAAVLINTFLQGSGAKSMTDIVLRVPVAISAPRDIQLTTHQGQIKLTSRLIQGDDQAADNSSWVTHTTGRFAEGDAVSSEPQGEQFDVSAIKARIGTKLKDNFSIEYLDGVGVSAMGFPWAVTEHFGNEKEMIARVDVAPDVAEGSPLPWDPHSWSPILDSATSIGSTLFFNEPRLRMPAQVDRITFHTSAPPPKIGYIYVKEATETGLAVHIEVLNESGTSLVSINAMRFAEIEGTPGASGSVESLVHQLAWPPMQLSEEPLAIGNVVLVSKATDIGERYEKGLKPHAASISRYASALDLSKDSIPQSDEKANTVIIYIPNRIRSFDDVFQAAESYCAELLGIVKFATSLSSSAKVFTITDNVTKGGSSPTTLAQAPLHGLGRIIASEQPEIWGALIDAEDETLPIAAIKYAHGTDVVRISDGVPRAARLRPLPRNKVLPPARQNNLLPRPDGTYLITGGLGALGLEVANFLVEKSARRLVLVSRRALPPRREWKHVSGPLAETIQSIEHLESQGASVHVVSVDIAAETAGKDLEAELDRLSLPPVLGVVHAAGVLEDQLIHESTLDSFHRVLAPKISGALALHDLFPPRTLDFLLLFSSCGQLFGFPGQGSYASGNAFLDTLATQRRAQGDNAVAIQWTSWRGLGMAASTEFINAELESKGITDVTRDEAFRAWTHIARHDIDHGVVLRSQAFDHDEPLPVPILNDIAVRRRPEAQSSNAEAGGQGGDAGGILQSGPQLKEYLGKAISECVAKIMQLGSADDVDTKTALSDLGLDSVMTVGLRRMLQQSLKVKVPPTLVWSHPTVSHLQNWFYDKLSGESGQ